MDPHGEELRKEREMKDRFMAGHPESPFVVGEVPGFHGLRYFPIDPSLRVEGVLERLDKPEEIFLRTNRDGELTCRYVGDLKFRLQGNDLALRVYHAGEQVGPSVFVPFRDGTCGHESYEHGRYLVLQLREDDRYTVDFNAAFNPYCAYTDRYECGYPPPENDLPLPIRAGEMAWAEGESSGPAAGRKDKPVRARPSKTAPTPRPKTRRNLRPSAKGASGGKGRKHSGV